MAETPDITRLLLDIQSGQEEAYDQLFPLVYDELRNMAHRKLDRERDDITITETGLIHEVYLKMIDQTRIKASDKHHFLAIAARCMRQILIDHARKKQAEKRGGDDHEVTYIDELLKVREESTQLIDLDEKITKLRELDERLAEVVTLRFFGQLPMYSVAEALGVSERTVKRDWAKARGWLYKELKGK